MGRLIRSFVNAGRGLRAVFQRETSFRWQLALALAALALAALLRLSFFSVLLLLVTIGWVLSLEIINSALEKTLDVFHPREHRQIALVKDIMAGAVLLAAIVAALIGLLIFLPRLAVVFG